MAPDSYKVKDAIKVGCCALNKKQNASLRRRPSKVRRSESHRETLNARHLELEEEVDSKA